MYTYRVTISVARGTNPSVIDVTNTDDAQDFLLFFPDIDLKDKTVRVYMKKPDTHVVFSDCKVLTDKKNRASFDLKNQMTAAEGMVEVEVIVYEADGRKMHQDKFHLNVKHKVENEKAVESTDEFTALDEALKKVGDIDKKQDKLISGENIKTINGESVLGSGDIVIQGGSGGKGEKGDKGDKGDPGEDGADGKSAYEIAVESGFIGTKEEWLASLKGEKGDKGDPGSGGSSTLQSDLTVSNPIGKYAKDDVITEGTELETIFRGMLSKTYYPTLTPPSCSLTYSVNSLYKVRETISAKAASVVFNRGSINPKYTAESGYRSGEATEYKLQLNGATAEYSETQTTNAFSVPAFTKDTRGTVTLKAEVSYSAGVQPKDSDGNDYDKPLQAGSTSASKTIEFILPFYYGVSDSDDINSFTGLTEDLSKKGSKTYYFNANNQHMVIAYDSSYGNIKSIIDANNFDLINGWTKTTKTIDEQTYNVYVSNKKNTDTNIKATFNF